MCRRKGVNVRFYDMPDKSMTFTAKIYTISQKRYGVLVCFCPGGWAWQTNNKQTNKKPNNLKAIVSRLA